MPIGRMHPVLAMTAEAQSLISLQPEPASTQFLIWPWQEMQISQEAHITFSQGASEEASRKLSPSQNTVLVLFNRRHLK